MDFIIVLALILLNGVFSMSEIAIVSVRKSKLKLEALQGSKSAKTALDLAEQPDRFLSTVQIGITLIGILTGMYSGDVLAGEVSPLFEKMGLAPATAYTVAKVIIVIIVTYLTLVIGELVPKRLGMSASDKIAKVMAPVMNVLSKITYPFVWVLSKSTAGLVKLFRIKPENNAVTEEEIKSIIQEGAEGGEVQEIEQDIVERVFTLGDRKVESIMTHRSDIVWIEVGMTIPEIKSIICLHLFESYPVADNNLDQIVGMVSLKDLFCEIDNPTFDLKSITTPAPCFPENMDVYRAFEQMKEKHVKQALIFDEFGSVQGIITFMDILEALVGEIPDDTDEPEIIERAEGGWYVDGQCSFYNFLDYFELENLYADNGHNTISGLILELLEHVPVTGETVEWGPFIFEVADMDGARIDKILVRKK
ncbi:HlyC/CorC family transporter [Paludibacter sp. 221]|uniref:hemolysin family protein n=1 Tax=Paludibacter sp. 221 TaxID=2302939 RepID=UPI0013D71FFB|nr:hemolysin family protein [Paludibacter sp. 221]NDV47716.1 HlyC/CorC family transporter [Paludibacter sp. 221]